MISTIIKLMSLPNTTDTQCIFSRASNLRRIKTGAHRNENGHISRLHVVVCSMAIMLFLMTSSLLTNAQEKKIIGIVTSVTGGWYLEGNPMKRIEIYTVMPAGGRVRAKAPNGRYAHIEIKLLDHVPSIRRMCDRLGNCGEAIVLPSKLDITPETRRPDSRNGSFADKVLFVLRSMFKQPRLYVPTLSRGDVRLKDSVVELTAESVHLRPVFEEAQKGMYLLRIEPVEGPTSDLITNRKAWLNPIRFRWDPDKPSVVRIPGLDSGLYAIRLLKPDTEDHEMTGVNAWVLVREGKEYQKAALSFRRAEQLTKDWGDEWKPDSESFLRAYLVSLNTTLPTLAK
jgi:hypothetical protein